MSMSVKSLQRKLLATTAVVATVTGVVGWKMFQGMKERADQIRQEVSSSSSSSSVSGEEGGEEVTVKRVLIRRKLPLVDGDEGEIVEIQTLGKIRFQDVPNASKSISEGPMEKPAAVAAKLSMAQKQAIFGSLVATFLVFNFWAIPRMRRRLMGSPSAVAGFFPSALLQMIPQKKLYIDVGCGASGGERLHEMAAVFDRVMGVETNATLARAMRDACNQLSNVVVVETIEDANLAEASLVYAANTESWSAPSTVFSTLKSGALMAAAEPLDGVNTTIIFEQGDLKLYRKD